MKVKRFPKGYDPMVASGECTEDMKRMDITWTPEDTQRMKEMELQADILKVEGEKDSRLIGFWYQKEVGE